MLRHCLRSALQDNNGLIVEGRPNKPSVWFGPGQYLPRVVLLFACVSFLKDISLNSEKISNIFIKFFENNSNIFIIKKIAILGTRNNLEQFTFN